MISPGSNDIRCRGPLDHGAPTVGVPMEIVVGAVVVPPPPAPECEPPWVATIAPAAAAPAARPMMASNFKPPSDAPVLAAAVATLVWEMVAVPTLPLLVAVTRICSCPTWVLG